MHRWYRRTWIGQPRYSDSIAGVAGDQEDEDLAEVFRALANPTRLAILRWLRDPGGFPPQDQPAEEVGVCLKHIQARAGISQSTASQFMAVLQRAGLVTSQRVGHWTHYRRNEARLAEIARQLAADI
jgi:DNA-binding transcriptional ArsR family regulator